MPHRLVALPAAQQQRRQVQPQRDVVGHRRDRVPQAVQQRVRFHGPVPGIWRWLPHIHSMASGDPAGTVPAIDPSRLTAPAARCPIQDCHENPQNRHMERTRGFVSPAG